MSPIIVTSTATVHEDVNAQKRWVWSITLSPNGALLATASVDGTVWLWNTETWTGIGDALEGNDDAVGSVPFSADGQRIMSGSDDGRIRVWSVETGRTIALSPNLPSGVHSVRFSCDGKRIISGYWDGVVRIWDALLDTKSDGMRVVSGSGDGTVRLWDSQSGAQIRVPLEGHTDSVLSVSFSPDGRQVVSGSGDCTVRLWNTETFAPIGDPLQGHTEPVWSVTFSFDGLRIVSGSDDGTVRVWNAATHEQIGDALVAGFPIYDVVESCDGCHVAARSDWESIIWNHGRRAIVWRSKGDEISAENEMSDEEAKVIVRNCGQQIPRIWPEAFPEYTAEVYSDGVNEFSNAVGEKTLLGTFPSGGYRAC